MPSGRLTPLRGLVCGLCLLTMVANAQETPSPTLADAAAGRAKIVDLTWPLNERNPYWPGGDYQPFAMRTIATLERNGVLSKAFSMPEHLGTHIDAPNHFEANQPSVGQIEPRQLIGPGVKLDITARAERNADSMVTPDDIADWEHKHGRIPDGAIVVAQTGWGRYWDDYAKYKNQDDAGGLHFPGYSPEAARFLIHERHARGIGIDTLSIDPGVSRDFAVHHIVNGATRYGLENLAALEQLPPRGFHLIVAPIRLEAGSGGPARIWAILPGE